MREAVETSARYLGVEVGASALALLDDAETVRLLAAHVETLSAAIGVTGEVPWPALDPATEVDFQLLAILGTVPATRRWFAGHGVSDEVAAASLADIARKLRDYGIAATGADWFVELVTARVFTLGRLQFDPYDHVPGTGLPAWNTHIPELGPLDPAACDASFAAAVPFFAATVGDTATRHFVCHSWLLDDQLTEYLPAESNILKFQRRFTLVDSAETDAPVDGVTDGDTAMAKFIFRRPLSELSSVTPSSRLEAAVVGHLAAGRHWRERAGVIEFRAATG
jgi:hypothetical protein